MQEHALADLQRALDHSRAVCDGPEAHGTLAGALCTAAPYRLDDWLGEILPDGVAPPADLERLRSVFDATRSSLSGNDFEFQLLLPDDGDNLADRTAALGEWVQGFLYGLGTGRAPDLAGDSELSELLRDLTEISRVDVEATELDEDSEAAFAELVEYVRVGVQLLFDRLAAAREPVRSQRRDLH